MYLNKLLPLLFVLAILFSGCTSDKTELVKQKISARVPDTFYNATNVGFTNIQDTLYYRKRHFSGYVYSLYQNKDTSLVSGYLNGLQEGRTQRWYPDKQLMELRWYVQGGKEGTHKGWWEDGKPKYIYHFVNDEYDGLVTEWFMNGKMLRKFNYHKGYETGSQKMWWENGAIRANYVVKDGQAYGLMGRKLCRNINK